MAGLEDKMKFREPNRTQQQAKMFFDWVNKSFYSDPTVSEVCDFILYTAYKFS
jgi:hypothetical protein